MGQGVAHGEAGQAERVCAQSGWRWAALTSRSSRCPLLQGPQSELAPWTGGRTASLFHRTMLELLLQKYFRDPQRRPQ